ncbi:hypothetical protein FVE85_1677 [Porphyridium purpureum]|uniref:Uncharacterized protein n=1 Tax=Porphyridium purpureum TaxID=35688 RepID=A0A5J4YXC7_PORPP|nr:hypothetical protein FVE85_1677 [Porphyridium purpureum]|eukprot:POR9421..scf209_3
MGDLRATSVVMDCERNTICPRRSRDLAGRWPKRDREAHPTCASQRTQRPRLEPRNSVLPTRVNGPEHPVSHRSLDQAGSKAVCALFFPSLQSQVSATELRELLSKHGVPHIKSLRYIFCFRTPAGVWSAWVISNEVRYAQDIVHFVQEAHVLREDGILHRPSIEPLSLFLESSTCSAIYGFEKKHSMVRTKGGLCNTLIFKNIPRGISLDEWSAHFPSASRIRSGTGMIWVSYLDAEACVQEFYDILISKREVHSLSGQRVFLDGFLHDDTTDGAGSRKEGVGPTKAASNTLRHSLVASASLSGLCLSDGDSVRYHEPDVWADLRLRASLSWESCSRPGALRILRENLA